jgi:hypothetical protein
VVVGVRPFCGTGVCGQDCGQRRTGVKHRHINNKFMRNYYYLFWSDAIQRFIKHNPKERGSVKKTLTLVSWVFTLTVLCTMLWLKYFHIYQSKIGIFGIFTTVGENISSILDMALVFVLIYIINYMLIFWRNRYALFIESILWDGLTTACLLR